MAELDVEALKQAAPLIPYVKKYYPQVKFVSDSAHVSHALCCFHSEKTGSLAFFDNGTYKCFGECGAHGDIFTFVQEMENLTWQEACELIGNNVGYPVVFTPPNPIHEAYKDRMDDYTRRYWVNLQHNQQAMDYITNVRGINEEYRNLFRLGVTDAQEYKFRTDLGNISNRIVFPILESKKTNPKCLGMGYREYLTDNKPKYVNDANQDGRDGQDPKLSGVFIKGNNLYGYPMAYDSIKASGFSILVEGYMDVVSFHQANVKNAVGSMGTAITETQVKMLKKLSSNVLLVMDGDSAGTNSMMKALPILYANGMNVNICMLPYGYDPADLCLNNNFEEIIIKKEIKKYTKSAMNVFINMAVGNYEEVVTRERMKAIQICTPILDSLNEMDKELFKKMLYNRLDM